MRIPDFIAASKDKYDVSEKLDALRDLSARTRAAGRPELSLLAGARIRQWEALDRRELPFEALAMFDYVANHPNYRREVVALALGPKPCALEIFQRLKGDERDKARTQLSQHLGVELPDEKSLSQYKKELFARGLSFALQQNFSSIEHAVDAATGFTVDVDNSNVSFSAAYNAVGLANEISYSGDFDLGYKILLHITKSIEPNWIRAHLFAVENRIRAYFTTGGDACIVSAVEHCRMIVRLAGGHEEENANSVSGRSVKAYRTIAKAFLAKLAPERQNELHSVDRASPSWSESLLELLAVDLWTGSYIIGMERSHGFGVS